MLRDCPLTYIFNGQSSVSQKVPYFLQTEQKMAVTFCLEDIKRSFWGSDGQHNVYYVIDVTWSGVTCHRDVTPQSQIIFSGDVTWFCRVIRDMVTSRDLTRCKIPWSRWPCRVIPRFETIMSLGHVTWLYRCDFFAYPDHDCDVGPWSWHHDLTSRYHVTSWGHVTS